ENTVCRFVTTQDVRLQPLHLTEAKLAWPNSLTATLTLSLRIDRGVDFGKLAPSPLRIYLHADKAAASLMHLFLTRHDLRVRITPVGAAGGGAGPLALTGLPMVATAGVDDDAC